ncbi:hypothetical protein JAAARDRAFT_198723 [Jaapia argillacea MUCL 33604]|uniref:TLC domain-containing protein n=1 Tax=Jaapia argillacea MUCL 33604 TaxID=933084 RepID=A0A067PLE8_9AGAM|nr:hypothetical protein JAAARDRAFT_198723 [Jaapia argillacea MUCL 33604]
MSYLTTSNLMTLLHFDELFRMVYTSRVFIPSLLGFITLYHLLAPLYSSPKQLSWILSTISSAAMTLASLPFVWDYLLSGGDVGSVRTFPALAYSATRFFQAYLVSDMTIGGIYYRDQVGLLTGWVHHSVYILVVELALRRSWAHIFCFCASMELPTFVLALGSLYPVLRNNILFGVTFFMTRIFLHLILIISYALPKNRHATGGSVVPAVILTMVFPMHALWFKGCVNGFIKRHKMRKEKAAVARIVELAIVADSSSTEQNVKEVVVKSVTKSVPSSPSASVVTRGRAPRRPIPTSPAGDKENIRPEAASATAHTPSPLPRAPTPQGRFRRLPALPVRRSSFERAYRKLEIESARRRLREARRIIYDAIPPREKFYDYLGLGKGSNADGLPDVMRSGLGGEVYGMGNFPGGFEGGRAVSAY